MIPLIHNLKGKKVVIFGGGRVGLRKTLFFYQEADVFVVSRTFCDELKKMDIIKIEKDIVNVSDSDILEIIADSFAVVAATSDKEINNRIRCISRDAGIFFNNADGEKGDIIIPSIVKGENYLISITTKGKSPGMSRYVRKMLDQNCPFIDEMIEVQSKTRELLKSKEPDQKKRNEILRSILDDDIVWEKLEKNKDLATEYIIGKYLQ